MPFLNGYGEQPRMLALQAGDTRPLSVEYVAREADGRALSDDVRSRSRDRDRSPYRRPRSRSPVYGRRSPSPRQAPALLSCAPPCLGAPDCPAAINDLAKSRVEKGRCRTRCALEPERLTASADPRMHVFLTG